MLCVRHTTPNTEAVLFACISSGWATTTGRLLGPKVGNSIKCRSHGHSDALPHREWKRGFATSQLLAGASTNWATRLTLVNYMLGLDVHLFVKLPRPGNSEGTFKGRSNPVKCLAQEHNKRTCQPIFTLTLLYAEHQAWKLWIPTFKVFWFDSARKSNLGLPTMRRTL